MHQAELNTVQYMGSKSRIINYVDDAIIATRPNTVVDLFAGSGTVGYSLKNKFNIISNDFERYAFVINNAVLNGCQYLESEITNFWDAYRDAKRRLLDTLQDDVEAEQFWMKSEDWTSYQRYCLDTPSVCFAPEDSAEYIGLKKLISDRQCGLATFDCLFTTYYANTYFGLSQCLEIDALHSAIANLSDVRQQYVMLTILMSAMSQAASTTTHFAQYLKVNSERSARKLIEKRSINLVDLFKKKLAEFRLAGLLDGFAQKAECYNLDYLDALRTIGNIENLTVYADPPYFKEHYSRHGPFN